MERVFSQPVSGLVEARVALAPVAPSARRNFYLHHGKRLFDILIALAVLPLILPVIGLIALVVRRDGGPAFFGHDRVGKDGRAFRCWKIRTMVQDGDAQLERFLVEHPAQKRIWDITQKLDDDPRVTAFGAFLRTSSLDELPQFFNVLAGEMSVVGPRPFTLDQEGMYRAAGGRAYYDLKPGITGFWQVRSRNRSRFVDRVDFDEDYRRQLGFWTDLGLILATVPVVLWGTGK